jgi:hypothetical protein
VNLVAIEAFEGMHTELVKSHLGQFMAIKAGEMMASDPDLNTLVDHIQVTYLDEIVLIEEVQPSRRHCYGFTRPAFAEHSNNVQFTYSDTYVPTAPVVELRVTVGNPRIPEPDRQLGARGSR